MNRVPSGFNPICQRYGYLDGYPTWSSRDLTHAQVQDSSQAHKTHEQVWHIQNAPALSQPSGWLFPVLNNHPSQPSQERYWLPLLAFPQMESPSWAVISERQSGELPSLFSHQSWSFTASTTPNGAHSHLRGWHRGPNCDWAPTAALGSLSTDSGLFSSGIVSRWTWMYLWFVDKAKGAG